MPAPTSGSGSSAQLDIDDLLAVPPDAGVVIVDTAIGIRAGRIVELPLTGLIGRDDGPHPRSSHALAFPEVVGLADFMRGRPLGGRVVVIGGASFGLGEPFSRAVAAALPALATAILDAVEDVAAGSADHRTRRIERRRAGRGRGGLSHVHRVPRAGDRHRCGGRHRRDRRSAATRIDPALLPDIAVGDWVVVAAGTIVERLSPAEAAEIEEMLDQARALTGAPRIAPKVASPQPPTVPREGEADVHLN